MHQAQNAYRVVLETYGKDPRLVRLYGKFLESVKNDPWGAAEYFEEADRLEQAKDDDSKGPLLPDGAFCVAGIFFFSFSLVFQGTAHGKNLRLKGVAWYRMTCLLAPGTGALARVLP